MSKALQILILNFKLKSYQKSTVGSFCLKMSASFEVNQGDFLFVIKQWANCYLHTSNWSAAAGLLHNFRSFSLHREYQFGCGISKMMGPKMQKNWPRINILEGIFIFQFCQWITVHQKVPKFDLQSQFLMSKIIRSFLILEYQFRSTFFYWHVLIRSIFRSLYY